MSDVEGVVPSMPTCVLKNCMSGTAQLCSHLVLLLTTRSAYLKLMKGSELSCCTPSIISMERELAEAGGEQRC